MTTVEEIQNWLHALHQFEKKAYTHAIVEFSQLKSTSKIDFNLGCCHLICGDKSTAIQKFKDSLSNDPHFALPWFLLGQIHYESNRLQNAKQSYEEAKKNLRGNVSIDYRTLGSKFVLHISEILINQALIIREFGQVKEMDMLLIKAEKLCMGDKIWSEISRRCEQLKMGDSVELLKYPINELFRPDQRNVKNITKKDFLGEAKVISTENEGEIYACFSGLKVAKNHENIPEPVKVSESLFYHKENQAVAKSRPQIPPYSPAMKKKLSESLSNKPAFQSPKQMKRELIVQSPKPVERELSVQGKAKEEINSSSSVNGKIKRPIKPNVPLPNTTEKSVPKVSLHNKFIQLQKIPPKPPKKSPKTNISPKPPPKLQKSEYGDMNPSSKQNESSVTHLCECIDEKKKVTSYPAMKNSIQNSHVNQTAKAKKPVRPPPPSVIQKTARKCDFITDEELKRLLKLKPNKPLPKLPKH